MIHAFTLKTYVLLLRLCVKDMVMSLLDNVHYERLKMANFTSVHAATEPSNFNGSYLK